MAPNCQAVFRSSQIYRSKMLEMSDGHPHLFSVNLQTKLEKMLNNKCCYFRCTQCAQGEKHCFNKLWPYMISAAQRGWSSTWQLSGLHMYGTSFSAPQSFSSSTLVGEWQGWKREPPDINSQPLHPTQEDLSVQLKEVRN